MSPVKINHLLKGICLKRLKWLYNIFYFNISNSLYIFINYSLYGSWNNSKNCIYIINKRDLNMKWMKNFY